jgi:hypothetical protein
VRAEPGHDAEGAHLEDAAERLVGLPRAVDLLDHRLARVAVEAAHGRLVDPLEVLSREVLALGRMDRPDLDDVREDLDPERAQEGLGQRAARHARGRLARRRPLEHVAHVAEAVLLDAREVGMAGPREVDLGHVAVHRPRVHPLLPVGVVAVADPQRDRAAERPPVSDAGRDLGAVGLDLHPPAAAVAELASREVAVDVLGPQLEPRGQALEHGGQTRSVRLSGCREAQRHRAVTLLAG